MDRDSYREAIKETKVSRWIELAIKSYRKCDKKKLKGLDK